MPPTAAWDAIVLAGGRGSRLGGVDKAALEIEGETLLTRTLRAVSGAGRVIVAGDPRPLPAGTVLVREEPRFAGPAAAIGAAMTEVHAPYVFLSGCDHPFLSDAVDLLLDEASGDGVIAIDGEGRRQYLMCVLDTAALRASIAAQASLVDLSVRALMVPLELMEIAIPARAALDIDTWHDRERALAEGSHDG
ncbi:NTP transferase domain-containing protein [Aeromicrobium sp. NPDC092404]|uniref:molybdenum cofactor guanylyltransferase n=1 Tax=Aeromicrobium sp. NPDC092404 TaxID=3154976 RepID=UPI003417BF93